MTFTEKYLKFLDSEFGISEEKAQNLSDDEIDELYDKVCVIEEIEAVNASENNSDLSERGRIATELVDYIWQESFGEYSSEDDEDQVA